MQTSTKYGSRNTLRMSKCQVREDELTQKEKGTAHGHSRKIQSQAVSTVVTVATGLHWRAWEVLIWS